MISADWRRPPNSVCKPWRRSLRYSAANRASPTGVVLLDNLASVIWLVTLINAFNFTDVCDGLVGGLGCLAFLFLTYLTNGPTSWLPLALAGSCLGFLFLNFPPATIFLGDGGSHPYRLYGGLIEPGPGRAGVGLAASGPGFPCGGRAAVRTGLHHRGATPQRAALVAGQPRSLLPAPAGRRFLATANRSYRLGYRPYPGNRRNNAGISIPDFTNRHIERCCRRPLNFWRVPAPLGSSRLERGQTYTIDNISLRQILI